MTMDETQPLLQPILQEARQREPEPVSSGGLAGKDVIIVSFDPDGDAENPLEWSRTFRWFIVALLAFMAFTVTFTCIGVVPVANKIVYDLDDGQINKSYSVLLVTIWELGEAIGPFFLAPLSEILGRYPVFNAANTLFIGATILAVLCQTTPLFIGARALTGLAVASNVLNPAIVADIFPSEERGAAMSIIMLAPLTGGAAGPAIAGAIVQSSSWRNVLWMSIALAGACELTFLTCFRETYKVTILRRKAARLREETGDPLLMTAFDAEGEQDARKKFWQSIMRPTSVFFGSGILQAVSLFGALDFTYFYVMSTTLPDILEQIYHLPPAMIGSAFFVFSLGSALSVVVCNGLLDRIYIKLKENNKGVGQPEYRLPLVLIGALTMPAVVAWYGWVAELQLPLSALLVSLGLLGASLMLAFVPLMVYITDAFGIYAASATTGLIVTRCLMGSFLPLATEPLVRQFGYGLAFTIMGGATLILAPIPITILRYGSKWRQRSAYTRDI